jgi:hypothetical protein
VPGEAAALAETVAGLRTANMRLRELLAERDARVAVLEAELEGLRAQVADLAAQVKRNSKNSSMPPSAGGLAKPAPKSLRKTSGRKPGRPKGQPGATLQLTDHQLRMTLASHSTSVLANEASRVPKSSAGVCTRYPSRRRRRHTERVTAFSSA